MFGTPFYHKQFKNIIGAFGTLFNNISLVRESTVGATSATASATVDATGTVTNITILTPGEKYTTPPTFTVAGGGTGCKAKIKISDAGLVTGFSSLVGGTGYPVSSTQTITFVGGGQPTTTTAQTIKVPIMYASADKAYSRKTEDGALNYNMKTVKPRMAFNLTNIEYDVDRKIQQFQYVSMPNVPVSPATTSTTGKMQVQPAPYNLSFDLYITVSNYEDGLQIVEQILPYFNPEIVIKTKDFPELNIFKDTPVILQGVQFQDNTPDSDYTEARDLEWTFSFVVKTYFYCPVSSGNKLITNTMFTIGEEQTGINIVGNIPYQPLNTVIMSAAEIAALSLLDISRLTATQISLLTAAQIAGLTTQQISSLTAEQAAAFTLAQVNGMTTLQRAAIPVVATTGEWQILNLTI